MRTCPSCQRTYSSGETACAVDGHALVDVSLSDTVPAGDDLEPPANPRASSSLQALAHALGERYEVQRKIGEGGMGAVYEARHAKIGKRVAIKVLLEKYLEKADVVARLLQEARLASSIGHENIVDITDFGETEDGRTFVVMEYLDGESLAALIEREGALPPARAIRIIRQVASALGAAHEKDIVHRDVKPENVFITRRAEKDFVKVLDFGISKITKPSEEGVPDESPRLTQTGVVLGTPLYMSPEQAAGEESLDHRIDVYALGTMLYETLTGEVPFSGPNYLAIISQILSKQPRPPSEVRPELGIPPDLEAVVLKAMAKDREERYASMALLDADLARVESGGRLGLAGGAALPRRLLQAGAWAGGLAIVVGGVALAVPRFIKEGARHRPSEPSPAPPAVPMPLPMPAPPPTPAPAPLIQTRITSNPSGAEVWWDSVKKGQTPLQLDLPRGVDQIELVLKLDGYEDARAKFYPTADQDVPVTLRLKKVVHAGKKKPPPAAKPDQGGPTSGGDIKPNPFKR